MEKELKDYLLNYIINKPYQSERSIGRTNVNNLYHDCMFISHFSHNGEEIADAYKFLKKNKPSNIAIFSKILLNHSPFMLQYIPEEYQTEDMARFVYHLLLRFHANPIEATADQIKDSSLKILFKLQNCF